MTNTSEADESDEGQSLLANMHAKYGGSREPDSSLPWLLRLAKTEKDVPVDHALAEFACKVYESRRLRTRYINPSLLGEPVWDMLLALYCLASRGEALSVSGLCHAAEVPQTTALRWVQTLEQKKLIKRRKDARDGRRAFVTLTDECRTMLDNYLTAIQAKGPWPHPA